MEFSGTGGGGGYDGHDERAAEQWLQQHLGIHKGGLGLMDMDTSNHGSMCGCPDDDNMIIVF